MNAETQLPFPRERFYRRERRSVPLAREFVRAALVEWGAGERAEAVLLCVSELATNALRHGVPPGRGFQLYVWPPAGGVLRLEVHDSGDGWPRVRTGGGPVDEGGRGLLLVEALADKWGVGERMPGKIVWCEFAL
ncbi:ATP-binding protein [Streptomyces sp. NRRL S-1813]|uniref:ATP-binding protein n=1 Tax=Streptomyces sp. NRRL S-1813 TaxID=1463888 RepID=UPI0004C75D85|nr:ATP-binding protein [Streptomyces sp. NRRL S-1813]